MRIPVGIDGARYEVVVADGFDGLGAALGNLFPAGRCVVVSNPVVAPLHGAAALAELRSAGWAPTMLLVPDGEAEKHLGTWAALVERLVAAGVDRRTPVLALGGGVTGDVAGFAAATVLRGLPFVQVPTTLLAMVDASVGGKTGVNTAHGKNLVGAFHQPALVWAPLSTLATLSDAELRCGLGEVLKHAVLAGDDALAACEQLAPALVARDPESTRRVVLDSIRTKAAVVEEDPLERGRRAVLNLGHTLGHAVETVGGYGALRHGEAVALGLVAIARWTARARRLERPDLPERLTALAARLGLPVWASPTLDLDALATAVGFDKKRARGRLRIVVPLAPGRVVLDELPLEEIPGLVASLFPDSPSPQRAVVEPKC